MLEAIVCYKCPTVEVDDHFLYFESKILLGSTHAFVDIDWLLLLGDTDTTLFLELGHPFFLEVQKIFSVKHSHLYIIFLVMAPLVCEEF